ncbi:MAG: CaiB/BaiF CoA transferase family protein [Candidatus Binataceae bacterium]
MPATSGRWSTPGCLDDVRVLEVGDQRGEYCGMLVAGQGADVIKIEPPGGSPSRGIGPFYQDVRDPNRSLFFWNYNRAKRGIVVDLNKNQGRDFYAALVRTADVIVDSQGPDAMDKLGLGYEFAAGLRPNITYCSITPFGLNGPWRDLKASDLIHSALGGMAYCCGYDPVDGKTWDTPPFNPLGWQTWCKAGEHSAMAVVAALLCRQMGGPGQFIDAAIHDAIAHSTEGTVPRYIFNGVDQTRRLPMQVRCADGVYLNVLGLPPADFKKVSELVARDGFAEDAEALITTDSSQFQALPGMLARWAATKPAMEAFKALQQCGLAAGAVRYPEDMIDDPHCAARENFVEIEHPEQGRSFLYPRQPRQQATTPWRWGPRAPLLGEHTEEIRRDLGFKG